MEGNVISLIWNNKKAFNLAGTKFSKIFVWARLLDETTLFDHVRLLLIRLLPTLIKVHPQIRVYPEKNGLN